MNVCIIEKAHNSAAFQPKTQICKQLVAHDCMHYTKAPNGQQFRKHNKNSML